MTPTQNSWIRSPRRHRNQKSLPSIWASMNNWLTPTVLFLFLNVVIGTIAFAYTFSSQNNTSQQTPHHISTLDRSPSSVLQRLRSINLSPDKFQPPIPNTHQTIQIQPQETQGLNDDVALEKSLDEVFNELQGPHISRMRLETEPASGELPERLPAKMRKSASMKLAFKHFEEGDLAEALEASNNERGEG